MKLLRCVTALPVMVCLVLAARAGEPPKSRPADLEVIGLQVHRALSDDKEDVAQAAFPGTTVDVYVSLPGRHIICTDADQSKLKSFTDDTGADLTRPQPG